MKKLLILALALLLAPSALGQTVGASQIKKHGAGGLVADSANSLAVSVYRATTAPSGPVTGQLWCDTTTTPCSLKLYNGSTWSAPPNTAVMTQATLATLPSSPTDGQIVWVSSQGKAIVYVASDAAWYYLNETGRVAWADYSVNTTGYPTTTLASPGNTTGNLASGGSMTIGAHSCAVTHYSATGGETLPGGTYTVTTTSGNQTMGLAFAATGANVAGKRIYCSKVNTTAPLFLVASFDDTTTAAYNVTVADSSFGAPAAPDEDFSAPLPAEWVFSVPDRSFGGCGSTPTGILCSMLKTNGSGSASQGPRAFYAIQGNPAAWRASWRVTRMSSGFTGSGGSTGTHVPFACMAAGATIATAYEYMISGGQTGLPFTSTTTPTLYGSVRAVGGVPAGVGWGSQLWPPLITNGPLFIGVAKRTEAAERSYRFVVSGNGLDYGIYPASTNATSSQRSYTTGIPSGSDFNYLGIAMEPPYSAGDPPIPYVLKMADLRWWSE